MKNIPDIRFKGFSDDWKHHKLGEILEITTRTNSDSEYSRDDVLSVSDEYGVINQIKFQGRSFAAEDVTGYKKVVKNDIIYTRSPLSAKPFGIIKKVNNQAGIVSPLYIVNVPTEGNNSSFIYYNFDSPEKTNNYLRPLVRMGAKHTMNISNDEWLSGEIYAPVLEEQEKIGVCFEKLDELIALQQHKYDTLKNIKQTMLLKMFPKEGENVPEIRFDEFTDVWEQRNLGEAVTFYNGQTPYRGNLTNWNGNINWLSSGDLNKGIVVSTAEKITEEGRLSSNLKIVSKGTVVISIMGLEAAGTRGNCGILGIDTTINQACMALYENKEILNAKYLFYWYQCYGNSFALKYTQGTKQQNYNAELLSQLPIYIPILEEQQQIGSYFANLDSLITSHQRKLQDLQGIKKALLQKMFI